jgi:MoxR-like ATPase
LAEPAVAPAPSDLIAAIAANLARVVHAPKETLRMVVLCLVAEGHLIIEDFPGVGKTMLAKAIARSLDCSFSRLQFTPDLLPSDVTGVNVFSQKTNEFEFRAGPVFANLLLVDEVNRASPKTQAALLECMQESQVTVDGVSYPLERPFMVMATQNPIEYEGTYPLPEAQLDRFLFNAKLDYLSADDELKVVDLTTVTYVAKIEIVTSAEELLDFQQLVRMVPISESLARYVVNLVRATRPTESAPDFIRKYVNYGGSIRAAQFIVLAGKARALSRKRYHVTYDDIESVIVPVLRHRMILNFHAESDSIDTDEILNRLVSGFPRPKET